MILVVCVCVVCVCVFIKLYITVQSGAVFLVIIRHLCVGEGVHYLLKLYTTGQSGLAILVILCHSHCPSSRGGSAAHGVEVVQRARFSS